MSEKMKQPVVYSDFTSPTTGEIEVHAEPPFMASRYIVPYMPPKGAGPKTFTIKYEKHVEEFETGDGMAVRLVSYVMKPVEVSR